MSANQSETTAISPRSARVAGELVRVNLLVPAALRKEWKAMALSSDKTLTDLIIEAMTQRINRTNESEMTTV